MATDRLSITSIHWRPLDLFHSIFAVVTRCSKFSFSCVPYKSCLSCSSLDKHVSFAVGWLKDFSLLYILVHETIIIILKHHISVASML